MKNLIKERKKKKLNAQQCEQKVSPPIFFITIFSLKGKKKKCTSVGSWKVKTTNYLILIIKKNKKRKNRKCKKFPRFFLLKVFSCTTKTNTFATMRLNLKFF